VLGRDLVVENVYVPAGGDVADREVNPKFGQKLDFLGRMTRWADTLDRPTLIVGDFNIAPLESDVWSHKQLLKVVSHTPIEVETLGKFQDAHGWVDLGRQHIPAPARYYSWWSYRNPAGRRTTRAAASITCGPRPAGAAGARAPRARGCARVGAAVRSRAADHGVRPLSTPIP
jgi:exodeoxyribonuclease III